MYHVELRQFPHVARAFNLHREDLETRFLRPWLAGDMIDYDDRRWAADRVRLKILEGPEVTIEEMGLGRGWAEAGRSSSDVTDSVIAQARRGAEARPELEALKDAAEEVAAGRHVTLQDVMALAAAAHPGWRASEQLALAEQTVWEMLHQGRLEMSAAGQPVPRERWQAFVLSWESWVGGASPAVRLSVPAAGR